ncbi:hypothetical protein MVEN_02382500 [Mycena venus]|uniref:Transposase family Tnp2 protein n=1 Tax=Mycena venus TaxID=2733690 RepID=A0A8H6X2F2_9AGAR|nr:hypothetical protein MVEN_02382500 [Mycena venus]
MVTQQREREHRRAVNSKPYVEPTFYPSRQRRVFAPSSEGDILPAHLEAGPSGTRASSPENIDSAMDPGSDGEMNVDDVDVEDLTMEMARLGGLEEPELLPAGSYPHRAVLFDESDSEDDLDGEMDGDGDEESVRGEDSDAENSDEEPDIFDWDSFKAPTDGLSEWDKLGVEFEAEAAIAQKLSAYDLAICKAFSYKLQTNTTDRAFKKLPLAFPQDPPLPKLDALRSRINHLAGFKPEIYDCCVNSCLCYAGPNKDLTSCSYCKEPRLRPNGKPRKKFTYIPIIPRLIAFAANPDMAEKQQYRANHEHKPGKTTDVFDGTHYRSLQTKEVQINGKKYGHKYFSDRRDVALGGSWDGFSPFKHRKKTAWPLIIFDYNLPSDLRFLLQFILALGVIPGPNKPKDSDSFLWPFVQELLKLAVGVRAFDILSGELFALRAYLILVFGDIPAVSMFMRMKGHNGISPCRMYKIIGLRIPNSRVTTHYVPLDRSRHPDVRRDPAAIQVYDAANLPARSAAEIIAQGSEVESAKTKAEAERLATKYGVKGVPLLSYLESLSFPHSFPFDFMHLIWENLIKNLILLWTGDFKGLDEGTGEYELAKAVWEAIASQTSSASDTIPSAYGSRIPNIAKDRSNVSAEMWSFWTLYLGPVLLRRRFRNRKYYVHFIELVRLLNICIQFEISDAEVEDVRTGFIEWVRAYEKLYFQYKPERLPICPLTIHALLHIAESIKFTGPVWCYWAFPMERYCGSLLPGIRSRRFPWVSLDRYVVEKAQLTQIMTVYNVFSELSLVEPQAEIPGSFADPLYPSCILLPPKSPTRPTANQLTTIAAAISTRTEASMAAVNAALRQALVEEWGKVRRIDSEAGDTMRSCSLGIVAEDGRDATYIRYEMLVDKNAHYPRRPVKLVKQTFYGQLTHLYLCWTMELLLLYVPFLFHSSCLVFLSMARNGFRSFSSSSKDATPRRYLFHSRRTRAVLVMHMAADMHALRTTSSTSKSNAAHLHYVGGQCSPFPTRTSTSAGNADSSRLSSTVATPSPPPRAQTLQYTIVDAPMYACRANILLSFLHGLDVLCLSRIRAIATSSSPPPPSGIACYYIYPERRARVTTAARTLFVRTSGCVDTSVALGKFWTGDSRDPGLIAGLWNVRV